MPRPKKKLVEKKEGNIKNLATESGIDISFDLGQEKWNAKTLEAESKTNMQDDKGQGDVFTLRFFDFAANPETFHKTQQEKGRLPTAQELFSAHSKQIEIELWKDEWQAVYEIPPRLMFSKDKTNYRIIIAAKPAKGSNLSYTMQPKTLTELLNENSTNSG